MTIIQFYNYKLKYKDCMFRNKWINNEGDYIKIHPIEKKNRKLIEIKNEDVIYKITASIVYNIPSKSHFASTSRGYKSMNDYLNITFSNMENTDIICDSPDVIQRFRKKIHKPDSTFCIKLQIKDGSITQDNKIITLNELLSK